MNSLGLAWSRGAVLLRADVRGLQTVHRGGLQGGEVDGGGARTGTAPETDARPDRLDLGGEDILRARSPGAKFAVDTDARSIPALACLRYGIGTAQRGRLVFVSGSRP